MARIHFLNVEEGDCSIIQHDNGDVTMIDVCNAKKPETELTKGQKTYTNISESVSNPKGNFHQKCYPENPITYLQSLGITSIFRYIQTHPDMDHMDGLRYIATYFNIINFWDTANNKIQEFDGNSRYDENDWKCYQRLRKSFDNPKALNYYDGTVCKYFAEDDSGPKGDDYLQILAPTSKLVSDANTAANWNDISYVILYHIHGRKVLFCGDAGNMTWNHILKNHHNEVSDIDVLIAPHHGRKGNLDFTFLDVLKPKLSLIGNALSKDLAYYQWNNRNLTHLINNQTGNVMVETNNNLLNVYCSNSAFALAFAKQNNIKTYKHTKLNVWYLGYI